MIKNWKNKLASALVVLSGAWIAPAAPAEDKPSVIRIGFPGVGVGNRPVSSGSALASAQLRGMYEDEFKKDGIEIKWNFLRGAGPAVNELYANGLLDFSTLGDLPSVIGRSSGLTYRLLAAASVRGNIYVNVPADSSVQSVKDLKGKRIAVAKGTATHLAGIKILEKFGLAEKDVKLINMDVNAAQLALTTRDIDATFAGADSLRIRDQGVSRVILTTRGQDPATTSNSTFLGADAFIKKYPEITKRVLKVYVQASKWLAEAPPQQIFQLWTKSGTTFSSFREDLQGEDFKYRYSPLVDEYIEARYNLQIKESKRLGLTRNVFSLKEWGEPKFLQAALKELGLDSYWKPRGQDGKPAQPDPRAASVSPAAAPAPAALAASN
ncbi:MAG: sulfate ester binding protein superfamily,peri bind [Pseudomonadota bacterium]|jgi:sulfonate transport system substrate-binding protein